MAFTLKAFTLYGLIKTLIRQVTKAKAYTAYSTATTGNTVPTAADTERDGTGVTTASLHILLATPGYCVSEHQLQYLAPGGSTGRGRLEED